MNNQHAPTLGFLLHEVARGLRKRFEQHAKGSGLTRSQWQVLTYLERQEGVSQTKLADMLDVEPITLGRIADKLQMMGLIERRPHQTDRRVWLLHLTDAARPKLVEVRKLGDVTRREALAGIAHGDIEMLIQTLQAMKTNLSDACEIPTIEQKQAHHA